MMPNQKHKRTRNTPEYLVDFETTVNQKRGRIGKKSSKSTSTLPNARLMLSLFSGERPDRVLDAREKAMQTRKTRKLMNVLGIDNMGTADYIPSSLDKPELVAVRQVNLLQGFVGRGLFATQDIMAGTVIGVYTGEVFSSKALFSRFLEENPDADNHYAMTVGHRVVDAERKGNFTRYINFSDSQDNLVFEDGYLHGKKVVIVRALKDIRAGQQFLINYNTHDEANSKDYFFLNPSDGWMSAKELYQQHQGSYHPFIINLNQEHLGVAEGDEYLLTPAGAAVMNGESLANTIDLNPADIDLPQLKLNQDEDILDFHQADVFTPLQLACYSGQSGNVDFLLSQGANKDYHQNRSGQFPLSLTLAGYAKAHGNKNNYMTVLNLLVSNQANIFAYDRQGRTFMHQAIATLSDRHFQTLLNTVKQREDVNVTDMFKYIDDNDYDVVLYSIKHKQLDKLALLLDLSPEYFENDFNGEYRKKNEAAFVTAIEEYTADEKEALYVVLNRCGQQVPEGLLEQLEFNAGDWRFNR